MKWRALAVAMATMGCGCSHVASVYQTNGMGAAVKRVRVVAWAPADHSGLAPVLSAVATDYLKLRKNYLVQADEPVNGGAAAAPATLDRLWSAACTDPAEGVVFVRALDSVLSARAPRAAALRLSAELYRCRDGALLYRSEGALKRSELDGALQQTRLHYAAELGEDKAAYVPCAFSLLQELLTPLFDPSLTEEELEEKIELGAVPAEGCSKCVAAAAQVGERRFGASHAEVALQRRLVGSQK